VHGVFEGFQQPSNENFVCSLCPKGGNFWKSRHYKVSMLTRPRHGNNWKLYYVPYLTERTTPYYLLGGPHSDFCRILYMSNGEPYVRKVCPVWIRKQDFFLPEWAQGLCDMPTEVFTAYKPLLIVAVHSSCQEHRNIRLRYSVTWLSRAHSKTRDTWNAASLAAIQQLHIYAGLHN
jgi:hypothetical protein